MQQAVSARAPAHLWIVGILSLLWNSFGAYDYVMSRMRNTDYFKSMMPDVDPQAMLNYIDSFPIWVSFGWGLGVWLGLAGSVLLLIRSRHAVWAFGLSLIGAILGLGYQLANPMPGLEGFMATGMPIVIILVAAFLAWYSWNAQKKGLLR
ncbi:MAG TPA: hypothetical protein VIZ66_06575 [Sphingomicrobium sp.]